MSESDLPALLGGPPAFPQGPPSWPTADPEILEALQAAYDDGSWGKYHGGHVACLEQRLADYHGVEHAVTCASGTIAVEVALRAVKVGPGDEVIMAAYDYGGNFLSVHAVGAMPVLVDVNATNWNLDPGTLKAAIGPRTRAMIASHLHGGVVPMQDVMMFAENHQLAVIEDAAQTPGARIQGRLAGTWGDVGVLSFGGSKLLTAGRGGALVTRRTDILQRLRTILHRGNLVYPLSELQAAMLVPQLTKLDSRNSIRADNAQVLVTRLRNLSGLKPFVNSVADSQPGYYKLGFQFDAAQFGLSREQFVAAAKAEGIALEEGFKALHQGRSPKRFRAGGLLGEADRCHAGVVVLHHPVLLGSTSEIETVASGLDKIHTYFKERHS